MQNIPLVQSSTVVSVEKFWNSLLIYHDRPHIVNRKILVCSQALFCRLVVDVKGVGDVSDLFSRSAVLYEIRKLRELDKSLITTDLVRNLVECYDKNVVVDEVTENCFRDAQNGVFVSIRILLPKNNYDKGVEVVILDKDKQKATFIPVLELTERPLIPPFPYIIDLSSSGNLRITVSSFEDADSSSAEWLADSVFSKLMKWIDNDLEGPIVQSLSLVSVDEYFEVYTSLKAKYAEDLVKRWPTKTNTDPQKYIFEDFAIAAYLICLWKQYSNKNEVSFVDCGCGNGLLVYVLTKEGFKGYGFDLRRRPTWDLYSKDTDLREEILTPETNFSSSNWLIGNHSDELTPWIPYHSLKSTKTTNFFVLPCCPYDFSGKKFIRKNTSLTQYSEYLNYIETLALMCNFDAKIDKLRIPSTKRTCIVGIQNKYNTEEERIDRLKFMEEFIQNKLSESQFTVRIESKNPRNCTQLNHDFKNKLIKSFVKKLLEDQNLMKKPNGDSWNQGGCVEISSLLDCMSLDDRKQLKSECGGIQTLLKNHRYIFKVEKGKVCLRLPQLLDETRKYKGKPCWFLRNHPQGCLYDQNSCAYNHD